MFLKSYYDEDNTSNTNEAVKKSSSKSKGVNFKKLSNRLKTVERNIEKLEKELNHTQQFIHQNGSYNYLVLYKISLIKKLKKDIEKKYEEWAEISQLIDN